VKRLLAVSWEMPPMYGPRATQVSRTLTQLAILGWRPTAVCLAPQQGGPHRPGGSPIEAPPGVELVRIPSPEEWLLVRAAFRAAPALRRFPDATRVWVPRAARAVARAAASGEYGGLVSFAQPWSDHLVGLRACRRTGLPWVAHFSDPWADSPYATARQRSIWRRMEEEVIREATAVVFVAEETVELVMKKYPLEWQRKVFVVPHGFDRRPRRAVAPNPASQSRPMRIVYTGRFYSGLRTPVPVLQALASLHSRSSLTGTLEVQFVGPHAEEYERDAQALGVSELVRFSGRLPSADAAAAAAAADVLLVIDAPSTGPSPFLPSKLVDYLPFHKPILGVTPEPGASARLLRRLGCPVAQPGNVGSIVEAIAELIRRWRDGTLEVGEAFDAVAAEFEIGRTAHLLHDVLIRAFGTGVEPSSAA
jgi:glycosyltransferase involved in cell wall biosynthesis